MRIVAGITALALSALALAQASPTDRQAAIWNEVETQMVQYVDSHFHEGDFPRVIQVLRFRYAMHPGDYEVMSDLGWMLENTERHDEALSMYIRYRQTFPQRADAAYAEAEFYFRKKAYAKIPPLLEPELRKVLPPNMYRVLAHSYERLGRLQDSMRVWDRYIGLAPEDQTAKNNRERVRGKIQGEGK